MTETWKQIRYKDIDWPYEIRTFGRVRNIRTGRILKPYKRGQRKGTYLCVKLCYAGKKEPVDIHRLVALHFIENPKNKPEVNHLDLDHFNPKVNNLEWCTRSENMSHRYFMEAML